MSNGSGLFKPSTSSGSLGKKKKDDGQFMNPPAYPEVGGLTSSSKVKAGGFPVQKTPTAKTGKV